MVTRSHQFFDESFASRTDTEFEHNQDIRIEGNERGEDPPAPFAGPAAVTNIPGGKAQWVVHRLCLQCRFGNAKPCP